MNYMNILSTLMKNVLLDLNGFQNTNSLQDSWLNDSLNSFRRSYSKDFIIITMREYAYIAMKYCKKYSNRFGFVHEPLL